MKTNLAYTALIALALVTTFFLGFILGNYSNKEATTLTLYSQSAQNNETQEQTEDSDLVAEEEEEILIDQDENDVPEEFTKEVLKTEVENIVEYELTLRGDAFTWTDNTTAMEVLQTSKQFTAVEAAALQSYLVDYFKSIKAEILTTASFQNPEKADGNIVYATKGDLKFKVGFIGVGADGAFYIAYAGL